MDDENDSKRRLKRGELRLDEDGVPLITVESQIRYFLHQNVEEVLDNGEYATVKMQLSKKFYAEFNRQVMNLLEHCILHCRERGSRELMLEDILEIPAPMVEGDEET